MTVSGIVLLLVAAYTLATWPFVLFSEKQPAYMLAWLLGVTALPVLGPTLFWLLGFGRGRFGLPRKKLRSDRKVRRHLPLSLPDEVVATDALERARPALRPLLRLARRISPEPLLRGNRIRLMRGAAEKYEHLLADIAAARRHIHLEYFTIKDDATGWRFAEALLERAAAGVEVRVLVDGIGSVWLKRAFIERLTAGGVAFEWFHPLNPLRRRWHLNVRNHRKVAVIDNRVAYTGGINLGDEYLGKDPQAGPWHDLAVRLEGPAVASLQRVFCEDWYFARGELLSSRDYFPPPPQADDENALVQVISATPREEGSELHTLYFTGLAQAQHQAWLVTPYFIPDEALQAALLSASLRGVDVRVLVARHTPDTMADLASRTFFGPMVAQGVPVYGFRPDAMLHAKALLVDGAFAVVGSANLDVRSFRINFETGAVIYDEAFAETLKAYMEARMAESELLDAKALRRRPLRRRTKEALARLVSPLL